MGGWGAVVDERVQLYGFWYRCLEYVSLILDGFNDIPVPEPLALATVGHGILRSPVKALTKSNYALCEQECFKVRVNRPFPISCLPRLWGGSRCEVFLMIIGFLSYVK